MTQRGGRVRALDGLRGFAAVAVIFYHSILAQGPDMVAALVPPIQSLPTNADMLAKFALILFNGQTAVLFFFVLSGMVLALSLKRAQGTLFKIAASFTVKRLFRIFPALVFCMAFCFAVAHIYTALGLPFSNHIAAATNGWAVLKNATLIEITMHGASWTLRSEIVAIPYILITFVVSRFFGISGLLACVGYAVVAIEWPASIASVADIHLVLYAFIGGMLVGEINQRMPASSQTELGLWLLAIVTVFGRLFVPLNGTTATFAQVLLCCALVGSIYNSSSGSLLRLLESPVAQYFGKVSYSLYLLNVPIMWVFLGVTTGVASTAPLTMGLAVGLVTLLVTLPFAAFSEWNFERGGIKVGIFLASAIRTPDIDQAPERQAASAQVCASAVRNVDPSWRCYENGSPTHPTASPSNPIRCTTRARRDARCM